MNYKTLNNRFIRRENKTLKWYIMIIIVVTDLSITIALIDGCSFTKEP